MSEELKALREAAEKRRAMIDPIKWASRPQLFNLSYLHPPEFYLDKKTQQPNEVTNKDSILRGGEGYRGGHYEIQQLKGQFLHLQGKLNEHIKAKEGDIAWKTEGQNKDTKRIRDDKQ